MKEWIKLNRILPTVTILVGAIFSGLILSGRISATLIEGVIIALLTLLAIDGLSERIAILRKIEKQFNSKENYLLKTREQLGPFDEFISSADELLILAISGVSLFSPHFHLFEQKLREGCRMRIVLLDPQYDEGLRIWDQSIKGATTQEDIISSITLLSSIANAARRNNQLLIRYIQIAPPFSLVATDPKKGRGKMVVEFHAYKEEWANLKFNNLYDRYWYEHFINQFENIWEDSTEADLKTS